MASIQRVANAFFNAIDKKEGSPYVNPGDEQTVQESSGSVQNLEPADESDQEELFKFIAEIEDATDKEFAAEEAAENEELDKIRYWNKEDLSGTFRRPEMVRSVGSDDENIGRTTRLKYTYQRKRTDDIDDESDFNDVGNVSESEEDADESDDNLNAFRLARWGRADNEVFRRDAGAKFKERMGEEDYGSEDTPSDLEGAMLGSTDREE